MNRDFAGIADDNKLPAAFDHMIATSLNFAQQLFAAPITINIANVSADDNAGLGRSGGEHFVPPFLVGALGRGSGAQKHIHGRSVTDYWLMIG